MNVATTTHKLVDPITGIRSLTGQSEPMGVAPDGSPVAVYLAIPGDAEAALIHSAIPAAASVLELGCGAGRVTRHLVARGHPVPGVDNSEARL